MIFAACLGFAIAAVIAVLLWHLHRGLLSVSLCPMECRTMWLWRWLAFSSWVCSATADVVKLNRLFWLSLKCIKKVKIYITTLFSLKYIHNTYIHNTYIIHGIVKEQSTLSGWSKPWFLHSYLSSCLLCHIFSFYL